MEYYVAIKRNMLSVHMTWVNLKINSMLRERIFPQERVLDESVYVKV